MMPNIPEMASAIAAAAVDDSAPDFSAAMQGDGHWGATSLRRPNGDWIAVVDVDTTRERITFEYKGRGGTNPGDLLKPVKRETLNG
jgi:hypothetical protein